MLGFNINSAAWSPDGRRLAAASFSLVTVWDLDNLESTPLLFRPGPRGGRQGIPARRRVARRRAPADCFQPHAATVLDWASGEVLYASATLERGAAYVEESSDGALLLTRGRTVLRPQGSGVGRGNGRRACRHRGRPASRVGARFFPDGKRVVTYGGRTPALHVWDALDRRAIAHLGRTQSAFRAGRVSPRTGLRLAGASRDGTPGCGTPQAGDLLAVFPDGGSGLASLARRNPHRRLRRGGRQSLVCGAAFYERERRPCREFRRGGPVAPGQIVSIFGAGLGPATPVRGAVDPETGRIPSALGGVSVLLDEEPAPLLYVQESQINAQVPYELAGRSSAQLAVAYGGVGGPRAGALPSRPRAAGNCS